MVIDLQEKDMGKDTTREDIDRDINIEEVVAYLKRKNPCFSIDECELGEDSSNKQERLKNTLRLYKSF
jgi:Tfp pilus assembly ATPase PilU